MKKMIARTQGSIAYYEDYYKKEPTEETKKTLTILKSYLAELQAPKEKKKKI